MRTSRVVFTAALLLALAGPAIGALGAQDRTRAQAPPPPSPATSKPADQPPPPPPPPPAPVGNRNVQVDVTVKLDGAGAPISKHMTLVGVDGLVSLGRAGLEIPVAGVNPNSFNYRSVGMNVDARPRLLEGNRIQLMLKLKFSAVLKPDSGGTAPGMPAFSNSESELNLLLESGKPLVTAQSSDAEVGRGYSVEVKATILK